MKNRHAVALGSLGGKARGRRLAPERRREIARKAVRTRWELALHPDDRVLTALAHHGAPVFGGQLATWPTLEETIVSGLVLSHTQAHVAKALPVLLMRRRRDLDHERLRELARGAGEARALGFFLDLVGGHLGDRSMVQSANALR